MSRRSGSDCSGAEMNKAIREWGCSHMFRRVSQWKPNRSEGLRAGTRATVTTTGTVHPRQTKVVDICLTAFQAPAVLPMCRVPEGNISVWAPCHFAPEKSLKGTAAAAAFAGEARPHRAVGQGCGSPSGFLVGHVIGSGLASESHRPARAPALVEHPPDSRAAAGAVFANTARSHNGGTTAQMPTWEMLTA